MAAIGRMKLEKSRHGGQGAKEMPGALRDCTPTPKAHDQMPGLCNAGTAKANAESGNAQAPPPNHVSISINQQLLLAAAGGRVENAVELLEQKADVETRDADGNTPLILASKGGHVDMMRVLLMAGADPNAQSNNGDTAKCWQSKDGCLEMADDETMRLLRAFGAD